MGPPVDGANETLPGGLDAADRPPPHPLLAGLLSLIVIGLGDAYNGSPGRGWRLLLTVLGLLATLALLWSVLSVLAPAPWMGLLPLSFVAMAWGLTVYAGIRAWRDARSLRHQRRPAGWRRACVVYVVGAGCVWILVTLLTRTFAMQAFKIPSGAMTPTLQVGDHIFVNKLVYGPRLQIPLTPTQISLGRLPGIRTPRPGDIVVFVWPKDRSKDFVKRVIAIEGQTIEIRDRQVFIDGAVWDDPHSTWANRSHTGPPKAGDNYGPYTVPEGHVFVMGDNRDQSYDSRFWGPLPLSDIKGGLPTIYWSFDDAGHVRGDRIGRSVE